MILLEVESSQNLNFKGKITIKSIGASIVVGTLKVGQQWTLLSSFYSQIILLEIF